MRKIHTSKPKNTFYAVTSVPSFEFWLLLHFAYTSKPFTHIGKISSGQAVLTALREHMPSYKKNSKNTFVPLLPRLATAMRNAELVNSHAKAKNTDNPTTQIHVLLNFMQNMKK